jgi:hypothetical protein
VARTHAIRDVARRKSRLTTSVLSQHQVAMKRCEARSVVLPLDQLRGLPLVADYNGSGVYFLWRGPTLLYVGQSRYVSTRVFQHRSFGKRFTHATYEKEHEAWIRHNESGYVLKYSPPLNMTRLG